MIVFSQAQRQRLRSDAVQCGCQSRACVEESRTSQIFVILDVHNFKKRKHENCFLWKPSVSRPHTHRQTQDRHIKADTEMKKYHQCRKTCKKCSPPLRRTNVIALPPRTDDLRSSFAAHYACARVPFPRLLYSLMVA